MDEAYILKRGAVMKINTIGDGTFEAAVARAPKEMQEISRTLRGVMAEAMQGVTEVPWVKQGNVGYGVGPKKMSEHFCYIMPAFKHVNLGFFYGANLDDPNGVLEGTGKLLRHVKVRSVEEARAPALKELVKQASSYLPRLKKN